MPTINIEKTGQNIRKKAKEAGMTMKDVAWKTTIEEIIVIDAA